ncbi:MAG: PilZ domain-containing protein [Acidobacteriota bacterium]
MSRLSEKLRTTFSRLVLEWGISPRYQTSLPLEFRIVSAGRTKKSSRSLSGQTYDVSETGISILSELIAADGLHAYISNDMITDTHLEIELDLPKQKISLVGQTRRYQKLQTSQLPFSYLLGIKIVNISPEDRKAFLNYIADLKRDPKLRMPRY